MDLLTIFNETSFQIAVLVIVLGFAWIVYQDLKASNKATIDAIREDSKEDKERLYSEVEHNRTVNAQLLDSNRTLLESHNILSKDINSKLDRIESKISQ